MSDLGRGNHWLEYGVAELEGPERKVEGRSRAGAWSIYQEQSTSWAEGRYMESLAEEPRAGVCWTGWVGRKGQMSESKTGIGYPTSDTVVGRELAERFRQSAYTVPDRKWHRLTVDV